ncbi:MAG TPA: ketol-acid reductoisomerase, partial [Candidatus Bathyarchaeia archaeon]|nr:ketol-acid reductoisomerase [Candidatus Bathyarchaeia archaeon]
MVQMDFGGVKENVITRKEFSIEQARKILKSEVVVSLGYGIQGRAQSLNMRDNGVKVIIGQEKAGPHKAYYDLAVEDGWIPGETLFPMEEAAKRGTIKMFLLTDSGQKDAWPAVKKTLKAGDAIYFSHGFSIVYREQTGVIPPKDVDVILVAPKGSGTSVRRNFVDGSGINCSFAVHQNATGKAEDRVKALGIAVGAGYLFPTTFEKEVYSDLTGERGVLMGALAGIMEAQYNTLREHGHSPSEAFNETVEELTQSLIRLVDENGMDWMYCNCSETARIGALRWKERFREGAKPLFDSLYELVASGEETRIVLEKSKQPDYRQKLADELKAMGNSEMWRAGTTVRSLRPTKL